MKLKMKLMSIIICTLFMITACSQSNIDDEHIANEVDREKMMTKIQNDVTEIMNKDYQYILENMGNPYCTTYYVDVEDPKNVKEKILVYPKFISQEETNKSAIYLYLNKDNRVEDVQTREFSYEDIYIKSNLKDVDLVVGSYHDDVNKFNITLEESKLSKYIGKNQNTVYEIVKEKVPNVIMYDINKSQSIKLYLFENKNNEQKEVLYIFTQDKEIEDIKILNEQKIKESIAKYLK